MENSPQLRHAEAEALERRGKAEGREAEIAALRADAAEESRKVLNTVVHDPGRGPEGAGGRGEGGQGVERGIQAVEGR